MKKADTLQDFIGRAVEACRLTKTAEITLMMQAEDTDPLRFTSVLRIGNENPFGDDPIALGKVRKLSALIRSRDAAHAAAARMIQMADINRNPDFVNGYLRVSEDGTAKMHVHYGMGLTTYVLSESLSEADAARAAG